MTNSVQTTNAAAAAHWDKISDKTRPSRSSWWASPKILRHINQRVCGEAVPGFFAGFHKLIESCAAKSNLKAAISVGCGAGQKEMTLLSKGIVDHFTLVEISEARIEQGIARARELNLSSRVKYIRKDDYRSLTAPFDLVYWNNSLHHMPDTSEAVKWSADRIAAGGVFAMDDFIGPSRFQWTDRALEMANDFRRSLPESIFMTSGGARSRDVQRPSVAGMIKMDPSEAADSSSIVPAIYEAWPDADIRYTGGAIYHTGLAYILENIPEDSPILDEALALDDLASSQNENHYAATVIDTRPSP